MELIKTEHITKRYSEHVALDDVSITIPTGSIFGLLGPNGAGKTSLIRIITQITAADEGRVYFQEEKLAPHHVSKIGYLPEERGLYKKMKVGEQLIYLSQLKGLRKAEVKRKLKYWIDKFEIGSWWNKTVEELSKGMQQKVQFIATVLHEPELLILDEPFSGFDPINANIIKEEILQLRDKGATIIFSTHRMESVEELCDYMALLNKSKKVLDGKKKDIKEAYRSNTFIVDTQAELPLLPAGYQVIASNRHEDGFFRSRIKLDPHIDTNALLSLFTGFTTVCGLKEDIPSINDIFIETVNQSQVPQKLVIK
ncbi:ABC transporter ATP-binding protein [Rapidithrix thailandica]|uniref:ABC transporter ATP-binding protein n=1 Tax=Rapidithrix thailandica TaxID=413964 RepID=A0AAW9SB40_9BACT